MQVHILPKHTHMHTHTHTKQVQTTIIQNTEQMK